MSIPPTASTPFTGRRPSSMYDKWALTTTLVLSMAIGPWAQAANTATTIWSGASSTVWTTAGNWSAGVPTSATVATFNSTFSNQPGSASGSVAGLWLTTGVGQDVSITGTSAITLTGTATINGNANTAILLDDTANHNLTITSTNPVVTLGANTSFLVNNAGTLTISKLNLAGFTLTLGGTNASGKTNITGVIGTTNTAGSLIVNTAGTVTLSGANTYTGGTTLNAGTLQLGATTGLGTAANASVTFGASSTGKLQLNGFSPTIVGLNTNATVGTPVVENGAATASTLTVNNTSANTYAGVLQDGSGGGTLALTKSGSGTLTLSGASTYTGVTTISNSGGVISVTNLANGGSSSALGSSSSAASNLILGNSSTLQYSGGAASTDRLFTINSSGATLDASGTGPINFTNTGNIAYGATNSARTLTLSGTNTGANTLAAVLDDNGNQTTTIVKTGTGTWTLSGANSYTGTTTLTGGILVTNTAGINGGNATGNIVFSGGTLQAATGGITTAKKITMTANGVIDTNGNDVSLSGIITTGAFTLSKNGAGSLTLTGNNNFAGGGFALNAGTLNINDNSALSDGTGSTGTFTINGGSIDNTSGVPIGGGDIKTVLNGDFTFLASRTLSLGTGAVSLGSASGGTRTITTNGTINQALTIGGVISDGSGATGLTKAGTGALSLTGNNTYSGLTTLSAGTLYLMGANTGAGGVRIDAGTLILGNDAALGTGTLTINGGHIDVTAARITTNAQVWNGDFTFDGNNTLTLGSVGGGDSAISLGTATGTSRTLTLAKSGTLLTINGIISDGTAKALVVTGPGDLKLNSTNTFTGGFTFGGGGELFVYNAGGVGTGTFTLNDGAIIDNWVSSGAVTTNTGLVINGDFTNLGRLNLFTLGTGSGNLGTSAGTARTIYAQGGSGRVLAINTNLANGTFATGIIKDGIGDLLLGGNNIFTGGVTVMNGRLDIGNAGALGTGTLTINSGEIGNVSGGTITNANNNAQVWNSDWNFYASSTGALNLGTGAVSLGTSTDTVRTINVAAGTSYPLTIGGIISNGTNSTSPTTGIVKTGQGILNLSGNNTYTGTTTVNYGTANFSGTNSGGGAVIVTGDIDAGTLGIMYVNGANGQFTNTTSYTVTGGGTLNIGDATTGLANRLNPASTLSLGGIDGSGTFNLVRGSITANSQSLVSLTVGEGNNTIGVSGSGNAIPVLTFSGATPYTRSAGGFVNFLPSSVLTVNFTNSPSGTGNVASGLLVGGILNYSDFIKAQAGTLTVAAYINDSWSSGNNTTVTTSSNLSGTPNLTTGSLRFNAAGNQTLTLAGANTIQSGGILVGSSTTATTSGSITGGSLQTGAAGGDLWIYLYSGKGLTINSTIADNSGSSLSVGGGGTLTLTGANAYTGRTIVGTGSTLIYDNSSGITVNNAQGTGTLKNNNVSGTLTLNQTGTGLSLGTLGGVGGSTVVFTGTGDTTIKTALGTADQTVKVIGGTVNLRAGSTTAVNLLVDGGTLNLLSGITINKASGTQTLTLNSGQINTLNSSSLFMRANGTGAIFTATQTGGTLSIAGTNSTQFQLGTNTSTTSTSTYNLSGGTLSYTGTGGFILYADPTGNSTSTFNLSGGTLLSAGTIQGNQGAGAKQAFAWTGGTLATFAYNAANLTSSAGTAVVTGVTNTLTNAGGTLAPGNIGTAGLTTITGNYAVTSPNAVLDIDIGGTAPATTFQQTAGSNSYDQIKTGSGSTITLGGSLNVRQIGGYVSSGENYAIMIGATTVNGTFTNLVPGSFGGSRVVLPDGLASFTVTLGTGNSSVVLGGYQSDNWWQGDGSPASAWSQSYNWTSFTPSQAGNIAKFDDNASYPGAQSVLLDTDQTIGGIQFSSTANQFSIDADPDNPGHVLTLNNNGAASGISVVGNHNINVPVALANDVTVTTTGSGDSLSISGAISGSGKSLTKTGPGVLTLGGVNTYTGSTIVSSGTLLVNGSLSTGALSVASGSILGGTGTIGGVTTIAGALNPGDDVGVITFNNNVTFQSGSSINIQINGATTRGTDYDGANFNGTLTNSGAILTFNISTSFANGTLLDIFSGTSSFSATFSSVVATGSGGYTGNFVYDGGTTYSAVFGAQTLVFNLSTGDLSFMATAIPEPATFALMIGTLALLSTILMRRNRVRKTTAAMPQKG